ncbi:hypothetical protein EU522_00300 [Candidatus Thorarchaeota archaeon]|nr:MAG: hypothetical protein EU522_00300 [Candidatus Thorarchaeota archaeon]
MSSVIKPIQTLFKKIFGKWDDNPTDQQTYVKIFFAIISAVICGLYGPLFAGSRGLIFGVLTYVLSLFVVVYIMEIDPEEIGGRQKLITNSLPTYLLLWVVLWTLFYAFTLPPSVLGNLILFSGQ